METLDVYIWSMFACMSDSDCGEFFCVAGVVKGMVLSHGVLKYVNFVCLYML